MEQTKRQLPNRTCVICGNEYYVCKSCDKLLKSGTHGWRMSCDTVECFQILCIITDYKNDEIDKEIAKELINEVHIDGIINFVPEAKVLIDEIYTDDEYITDDNDGGVDVGVVSTKSKT